MGPITRLLSVRFDLFWQYLVFFLIIIILLGLDYVSSLSIVLLGWSMLVRFCRFWLNLVDFTHIEFGICKAIVSPPQTQYQFYCLPPTLLLAAALALNLNEMNPTFEESFFWVLVLQNRSGYCSKRESIAFWQTLAALISVTIETYFSANHFLCAQPYPNHTPVIRGNIDHFLPYFCLVSFSLNVFKG